MADRYWVGGAGNWNSTAASKWSLTSGGAGGEAIPTASDDVFFDAASGAVTVTATSSSNACLNLNFTGFTGTFGGSQAIAVSGNLTYVSGMTLTHTGTITFKATSGTKVITSGTQAWLGSITFNG